MNNLLLIIDLQEGFRHKESEAIIPKILKLKKCFAGKIVFTKFINKSGSLFEKQLDWQKFKTNKDQQLFAELRSKDNLELEHSSYTVLNDKLKKFIAKNKITTVYLCGIYTDVCVIKTAMDLFDFNIKTFVIKDATISLHGKNNHLSALNSLQHILGKQQIISTNKIC
jgi:nicotinamidase-related amidase